MASLPPPSRATATGGHVRGALRERALRQGTGLVGSTRGPTRRECSLATNARHRHVAAIGLLQVRLQHPRRMQLVGGGKARGEVTVHVNLPAARLCRVRDEGRRDGRRDGRVLGVAARLVLVGLTPT